MEISNKKVSIDLVSLNSLSYALKASIVVLN